MTVEERSPLVGNDNGREVFSAEELVEMTGLSIKSVYEGARSGDIPSVRVGRRVLFPKQAIRTWLNVVEWDRKVAGGE